MKRCLTCSRIYSDESLNYCLDDGSHLIDDPHIYEDPPTAVLSGEPPNEAPTRRLIDHTDESAGRTARPTEHVETKASILYQKRWLLPLIMVALTLPAAALLYRYSAKSGGKQISSIAVLPFENLSGDSNLDYLADGVSESVIDRLSRLPQLKVIARGSSFKYRGPNVDLGDVARTLGVDAVVTGRLVPRSENYDVRVELIDARDNR